MADPLGSTRHGPVHAPVPIIFPMVWDPGARPAWVRHTIAGEGGPMYEAAAQPFDLDQLLAEARARAGLDDLGGDTFVEPLAVLIDSLDTEADLHLVGRWRVREVMLRALENRLRITEAVRQAVPGSTATSPSPARSSCAGAHGRGRRSCTSSSPWRPGPVPRSPGSSGPRRHPPIRRPRPPVPSRRTRASHSPIATSASPRMLHAPTFDGIHEQGARLPRECMSAMILDFRSDVLCAHYPVPSYIEWFNSDDLRPAYAWHQLVLQVLQRRYQRAPLGRQVAGPHGRPAVAARPVPGRERRRLP